MSYGMLQCAICPTVIYFYLREENECAIRKRLPMRLWHIAALLAAGAVCAAELTEPTAQAKLGGMRCIYASPHDGSGRRMELRVVVSPMESGWQVNEAGARAQRIRGTDQNGNTLSSAPCAWGESAGNPGSRTAVFIFPLPKRVDYLLVNEVLQVRLARNPRKLEPLEIDLLKPTELPVPGGEGAIRCIPAEKNGRVANRDADGSLLRADITLICPVGVSVLRAVRVWSASETSVSGNANHATQDLEVRHFTTDQGETGTSIVLWNAGEKERLQLELCSGQRAVSVPLRFRAMLGDRSVRTAQTAS